MLYRCASETEFEGVNHPRASRRPPANVPYLIDNLWSWLRPANLVDRRGAVFASASPELARSGATRAGATKPTGRVGRVHFCGSAQIVQIPHRDARDHPDVDVLRNEVVKALGDAWFAQDALVKAAGAGRLFMPLLTAAEVAEVLQSTPALASALRQASTFWKDACAVTPGQALPHAEGEVFFHAAEGWQLQAL